MGETGYNALCISTDIVAMAKNTKSSRPEYCDKSKLMKQTSFLCILSSAFMFQSTRHEIGPEFKSLAARGCRGLIKIMMIYTSSHNSPTSKYCDFPF